MTDELKKPLEMVVCMLERDGKYLLPLKEAKIGAGLRNGVGGKRNLEDKSIRDTAIREIKEESGVIAQELEEMGVLIVENPDLVIELHVFLVTKFLGEPREQKKQGMKDFKWFPKDQLPFDQMWPSDRLWYDAFREGRHFRGRATLGEDRQVISHEITEEQKNEFKVR